MKKFLVAALLLLMIGSTSLAFAWWNSLETTDTVTVGVGDGVSIEIDLDDVIAGQKLVPAGQAVLASQVDEIVVSYVVTMDKGENLGSGLFDLAIEISKSFNGDNESHLNDYLAVDFTPAFTGIDVDGKQEVVFTITLNMNSQTPEADVTAVKNGSFVVTIDFELTPQVTSSTETIDVTGSTITP